MKKFFMYLGIAAMAFSIAACEEKDKPDVNNITEDGFYVALDPTGKTPVTDKEMMAKGINEAAKQTLRDGMYEKYIVLEANQEFSLAYINGGKMELYGAVLTEFKPAELTGIYEDNPADAVFKGTLVIGDSAPKMKVAKKGLYHIVLDLNLNNDLSSAQIVLCPVTMGVRGGMNSWGFTALDATEPSNDGITFTLSGQKLADGGEFKFAYNGAWKITLDEEGAVKANTNLGKDCKPGGDNLAVTEGAGTYKITLNYKLAAGDIAKSFSYSIVQETKSETPTTMYMIGQDFGNWDWNSAGVAELIPVWGKEGAFWCTRYFTTNGFKFCALREWNGDFTGLGSDEGFTVAEGNCFVPAEGMYTVYINLIDKVLEIKPAEVYGLGDAVFTGGWDFDSAQKAEVEDGKVVITTSGAGELRLASKVMPTVKVEGCGDFGWYDWWKTEFIFFADGKIVYRGGGNDQERVQIEAGKKIILDFNAGTATVEEGGAAEVIKIDGDISDWADIAEFTSEATSRIRTWKVASDSKNVYVLLAMRKNRSDSGRKLTIGFNTDKDASTGKYTDDNNMKGCEALVQKIIPFTNASGEAPVGVNGVIGDSKVYSTAGTETVGVVSAFAYDDGSDLSSDSSNIYLEVSIPKSALALPSGEIQIGASYDYYFAGYQVVAL